MNTQLKLPSLGSSKKAAPGLKAGGQSPAHAGGRDLAGTFGEILRRLEQHTGQPSGGKKLHTPNTEGTSRRNGLIEKRSLDKDAKTGTTKEAPRGDSKPKNAAKPADNQSTVKSGEAAEEGGKAQTGSKKTETESRRGKGQESDDRPVEVGTVSKEDARGNGAKTTSAKLSDGVQSGENEDLSAKTKVEGVIHKNNSGSGTSSKPNTQADGPNSGSNTAINTKSNADTNRVFEGPTQKMNANRPQGENAAAAKQQGGRATAESGSKASESQDKPDMVSKQPVKDSTDAPRFTSGDSHSGKSANSSGRASEILVESDRGRQGKTSKTVATDGEKTSENQAEALPNRQVNRKESVNSTADGDKDKAAKGSSTHVRAGRQQTANHSGGAKTDPNVATSQALSNSGLKGRQNDGIQAGSTHAADAKPEDPKTSVSAKVNLESETVRGKAQSQTGEDKTAVTENKSFRISADDYTVRRDEKGRSRENSAPAAAGLNKDLNNEKETATDRRAVTVSTASKEKRTVGASTSTVRVKTDKKLDTGPDSAVSGKHQAGNRENEGISGRTMKRDVYVRGSERVQHGSERADRAGDRQSPPVNGSISREAKPSTPVDAQSTKAEANFKEPSATTLKADDGDSASNSDRTAAFQQRGAQPTLNRGFEKVFKTVKTRASALVQRYVQQQESASKAAGAQLQQSLMLDDGQSIQIMVRQQGDMLRMQIQSQQELNRLLNSNLSDLRNHLEEQFQMDIDVQLQQSGDDESAQQWSQESKAPSGNTSEMLDATAGNGRSGKPRTGQTLHYGYNSNEWTG